MRLMDEEPAEHGRYGLAGLGEEGAAAYNQPAHRFFSHIHDLVFINLTQCCIRQHTSAYVSIRQSKR